ncbi:hypothetical protein FHS99_003518 [Sphingomonas prati]|uniref:Uncharacterized protein n=2 Tax=Sphingomonas prati TaxID=1843237 RepID=A0A7W9BW62_9SPHN|nr:MULTISPECIES: hypothetical protein [Sphingomonas]MBB5731004.1 hypothetical protein [Sphingomonas prati]
MRDVALGDDARYSPRMYNLIVRSGAWGDRRDVLGADRIFESTERQLVRQFKPDDEPDFERLRSLPCLFMVEGTGDQLARVGELVTARIRGGQATLEYRLDDRIPPIRNCDIYAVREEFGIDDAWEFSRNHWAIKDVDLFQALLRLRTQARQRPQVFTLDEVERIDPDLVSVMMPFDAGFNSTYSAIRRAAEAAGYRCQRADEIWERAEVIADVVSLIDRSSVVICDCTGRNANVFYEMGIAHTLGREVIPITQSEADIPFDIRHIRHVRYLPNREGRRGLSDELQQRLEFLRAR